MSSQKANVRYLATVGNKTSGARADASLFTDSTAVPRTAKWSFVTRRVHRDDIQAITFQRHRPPAPGDLIVAAVERIAQHTRLQLPNARRSRLYVGDRIVVAYGNRYAPDQFEAEIPEDLSACHLVAAGGLAATALSKLPRLKWPTAIRPEGYCLNDNNEIANLSHYALPPAPADVPAAKPVVTVVGTSMNAGKTTTVAGIVRGLTEAGLRVAALKVTGTGASNDLSAYRDAGAAVTLDFTDMGHASTYRLPMTVIVQTFQHLMDTAQADAAVDAIVVEVADGLLHLETAGLVASATFREAAGKVVFAASDAMGALAGSVQLQAQGIDLTAISGLLSVSSLATREAERATGLPVLSLAELEHPGILDKVLG